MWVNALLFQQVLDDNKAQQSEITAKTAYTFSQAAYLEAARLQKAKDDLSLDWMRHRVNALEKQNAVLMMKATGVAMPIPEIVPTRPGSISFIGDAVDSPFDTMPSFEDVGDSEALRLGIKHSEDGAVEYGR